MAIASGHRRSALRALPAAPGHIRWDGVRLIPNPSYVAKNQTASKPVKIFLSSLSRHTHRCPKTRSGVLSGPWSTFGVLRTGGRAISFSFARGSLFPPLREMSFRSGLWLLSVQLAPRCCRPGLRLVHTTPGASDASWALFTGVSVEEIRQPIGSRLILHLLFTFGMSPPPSCLFLVQPCWRRHFPVNPIHCPLWGSRSQASRTFSVWV